MSSNSTKRPRMTCILALALAAGGAAAQDTPRPPRPEQPPGTNQPPIVTSPRGATGAQPPAAAQPGGGDIQLLESSEPIELRALVDYIAETLNITITADDELTGSIVVNAPKAIPRDELITFLDSILEQNGFTIIQDQPGFYRIIKVGDVPARPFGMTTKIIPTPTVRPSSLQEMINNQLGRAAAPGAPAPSGAPRSAAAPSPARPTGRAGRHARRPTSARTAARA